MAALRIQLFGAVQVSHDGRTQDPRLIHAVQSLLAWLLLHSPVTLPIPGTSSVQHLEENVAAAALALDSADMVTLEGG